MQGIVIKSTGSWYIVKTDDGELLNCRIRGKFRMQDIKSTNPIVVGDKVPNESWRGKFVPASVTSPDEIPDDEFEMILTTGRQLEHWHTGAMTRKASNLDAIEPEATVSISPNEILKKNMKPGDKIKVSTRRGTINIRVREDRAIPEGVIFIPFCYNEAAANLLTNPALDPYGKIPEFKYCAAKIEKIN